MSQYPILLRHREIPGLDQLESTARTAGFEAFEKAVTTCSRTR